MFLLLLFPTKRRDTLVQIYRERLKIFQTFMFVPSSVVKRLSTIAQERFDVMQAQVESKDGYADLLDDVSIADGHDVDWRDVSFGGLKLRKMLSNYRWGVKLALQLASPVLLVMVR